MNASEVYFQLIEDGDDGDGDDNDG